jgi:hypothetical protein
MPIYLLPLDLPNGLSVNETTGGTLSLPQLPGFSLTIAPGSATFPDGSKSGLVSVTVVHADKIPMTPNFGLQPRFIITIQPAGVLFDPPAPITLPNVDGLTPGEVTELYSFDHDLGQFVSIGTGTVSEDGTVVRSDTGVGIIKGGWHCGGNPAPTAEAEQDQCSMSADDTAKRAEEFATTNPNAAPFAKIQACIARKTCSQAKDGTINDPEWAETVVPKFIDRFLDQTGKWPEVLDQCQNSPLTNLVPQIAQLLCAERMAKQHIQNDLGDAMTQTGDQFGDPLRGCAQFDEDWNRVFDNILECIPEGNLPSDPFDLIDSFIKDQVNDMRNDVRDSCRKKARGG